MPTTHSPNTALAPTPQFLLDTFGQTDWVKQLCNSMAPTGGTLNEAYIENLGNPSVKCLLLANLLKQTKKPLMVICADPTQVHKYHAELSDYLNEDELLVYPTDTYSPYDQSTIPILAMKDHYGVLERMEQYSQNTEKPFIVLLSPKSLLLKHISYSDQCAQGMTLTVNKNHPPEEVTERLLAMGYVQTSLIMEPGEFSRRGDILDIYPINGLPVRTEFFGDTLETCRTIDIENQRSTGVIKTFDVLPRYNMVLDADAKERMKNRINEQFDKHIKELGSNEADALHSTMESVKQSLDHTLLPDGIDYYAPLLRDNPDTDFVTLEAAFPPDSIAILDDWNVLENTLAGFSDRLERQYVESREKGRLLDLDFCPHVTDAAALQQLKERLPNRVMLDTLPLNSDGQFTLEQMNQTYPVSLQMAPRFKANLPEAIELFAKLRREKTQVIVTTQHPQRVLDACKEHDVPAIYWAENQSGNKDKKEQKETPDSFQPLDVIISKSGPHEGFILDKEFLAHYTDTELFGRSHKRVIIDKNSRKRRDDIDVINSINDLKPGDYVVHVKHGIGQFQKVAQIRVDNEIREYLTVQYAGTDRLHVPVDQVNLLSRYRGAGDKAPKLNKMGGTDWGKVKKKAEKAIASIARDLIQLYAKRAKANGHPFEPDSPWQVEMEDSFPFTETPDQWQAIGDMKADMESDKVMDRLICGDVGFGKTEVALRGIFKAVLSGKQVAVLAPTTILVQQHFNTLSERFKPYPVRMGLLSRFRTAKEQREVVKKLNMGEVDVVVGTHRLLQKDIKFKDLGLVVIDEEQRFGVSHKEKLKELRAEVDVLTLSATPIPRTLYMSLSGVRDMSLIKTPPTSRLPIQTYVGPYNPAQVRMAILQEIDRGGQVYFLHNRVQTIFEMQQHLQDLIPEVRFGVGHGQMTGDQLETVMLDFAEHEFDVLICTTIIESGLDIPNVNTIIIDQANKFGLAQLYQIRGRVGRSNKQAYAYCYYNPERELTKDAQDRLRALREFTTLGSGYQIALRDLEIRGVGNILGAEQHGHMIAIGFDLYCQMLEDAIEELRGNTVTTKEQAIVDLNVTALIPEEWVGDLDVKLSEYKRLAGVTTELQLEHIQAEWQDRFGDIPEETQTLVKLVQLRLLATSLHLTQIRADDEYIRVSVPYTLKEWMLLQNKLDPKIGKKARWVPGIKSSQGSTPVLLIKHLVMDGEAQVNYLMELLGGIKEIIKALRAQAQAKKDEASS